MKNNWIEWKEWAHERPLIDAFFCTFFLFFLFFLFFTSTFETNDDAYMMLFASGFYLGQPVEYILPSGVFLGIFLKNLYVLFPAGNWYVWYLLAAHFVSVWILFYLILRFSRNISFFLAMLVSVIYFESYFLVYLQFTTTAFLVSIAGLFLFLHASFSNKSSIVDLVLPIFLLIFASQIREKVPLLVLAVASPALAYTAFFKKYFSRTVIFSVSFLGLFFASQWLENNYQGKLGDWGKHRSLFETGFYPVYNKPLCQFSDDSVFFQQLGWSQNDFVLFQQGFFEEIPTYSMENLQKIAVRNTSKKMSPESVGHLIGSILLKYRYLTLITFFSLIALFFRTNKWLAGIALTMLCLTVLICFYIGLDLILKARVVIPLLFLVQLFCIFSLVNNPLRFGWDKFSWMNIGIGSALVVIAVLGIARINKNDTQNIRPSIQSFENQYKTISAALPDNVLVIWGIGFSVDHFNVLSNFYADKKKASLYLMLANLGYWHNPELLKIYHETNVNKALLTNPKFLLLLTEDKKAYLPNVYQFYWEKYKIKVGSELVHYFPDPLNTQGGFSVYRIVHDSQ